MESDKEGVIDLLEKAWQPLALGLEEELGSPAPFSFILMVDTPKS